MMSGVDWRDTFATVFLRPKLGGKVQNPTFSRLSEGFCGRGLLLGLFRGRAKSPVIRTL